MFPLIRSEEGGSRRGDNHPEDRDMQSLAASLAGSRLVPAVLLGGPYWPLGPCPGNLFPPPGRTALSLMSSDLLFPGTMTFMHTGFEAR